MTDRKIVSPTIFALASLLFALVILGFAPRAQAQTVAGSVTAISGTATINRSGATIPAAFGTKVDVGDRIVTDAGIGHLSTHTMRHTHRSWLDAVGTPIAVQQKLMRHADIRTTMNVYGDVVTNQELEAHSKVVKLAIAKPQ